MNFLLLINIHKSSSQGYINHYINAKPVNVNINVMKNLFVGATLNCFTVIGRLFYLLSED